MKNTILSLSASLLTLLAIAPHSALAVEPIEIALDHVFIPEHGYDDNDLVQLVAYGNLPNACYTLGETKVETSASGLTLTVHQYAMKNPSALCSQESSLPPHANSLVPFTVTVPIGVQKAGTYNIDFWDINEGKISRSYQVEPATTKEIDAHPYAAVSNAMLPDVIFKGDKVFLTFSGVYQNSCVEMDRVEVKQEGDVFVVLPILKVKPVAFCLQVLMPFKQRVLIADKLRVGEYMIHMRSMSGQSINRVFDVVPHP